MQASASDTGELHLPAAIDGDIEAFGRVVRSYDAQMRALAFGMLGSAAAMDDALQDAYLKAFRSLSSFRGDARFATWLHTIVSRTCVDHLRKESRTAGPALDDIPEAARTHSFEERIVANAEILAALAQLTEDQRATVLLIDLQGFSYDEAAAILEVEAGTVSSRISRARSTLRTILSTPNGERTEKNG